ncbi:hypothetical protein EDC18_102211 [Natranaerovirga pectinivora]|uniref:Uncharacterized protein n=1 Tax=Natranaerovirga pectinivora TaxID=682400 RepID=A0A4R3MML3_9FIRM|nr:hypothetical protein [Natranaerovirga pectinivora]TCT16195.1 hypothetical protein EDC18_102211 [Natranaerovirga pectinivora]
MKKVNQENLIKFALCIFIGTLVTTIFNNIVILILISLLIGYIFERIQFRK